MFSLLSIFLYWKPKVKHGEKRELKNSEITACFSYPCSLDLSCMIWLLLLILGCFGFQIVSKSSRFKVKLDCQKNAHMWNCTLTKTLLNMWGKARLNYGWWSSIRSQVKLRWKCQNYYPRFCRVLRNIMSESTYLLWSVLKINV